jgi:hypothetical protein
MTAPRRQESRAEADKIQGLPQSPLLAQSGPVGPASAGKVVAGRTFALSWSELRDWVGVQTLSIDL